MEGFVFTREPKSLGRDEINYVAWHPDLSSVQGKMEVSAKRVSPSLRTIGVLFMGTVGLYIVLKRMCKNFAHPHQQ